MASRLFSLVTFMAAISMVAQAQVHLGYTSTPGYGEPAQAYDHPTPMYDHPAPEYSHSGPVYGHAAPTYQYANNIGQHVEADYDSNPEYSFSYDVHDEHTGDIKSQQETRHGDVVEGSYSLIEADGSRRIVEYKADAHSGFNAVVHNEPAAHAPIVTTPRAPMTYSTPAGHIAYPSPTPDHVAYNAPTYSYEH